MSHVFSPFVKDNPRDYTPGDLRGRRMASTIDLTVGFYHCSVYIRKLDTVLAFIQSYKILEYVQRILNTAYFVLLVNSIDSEIRARMDTTFWISLILVYAVCTGNYFPINMVIIIKI